MAKRTRLERSLALFLLALPVMVSPSSAQEAPSLTQGGASIADLSWLAGHWYGQLRAVRMEELWLPPDAGLMLGIHREVQPDGDSFFEFLRISSEEGNLVYYASPEGKEAVPFPLKELSEEWVVFENLENEFPQRIIYLREGKQLHARIEGERGGRMESQSWIWFGK